MYLKLDIKTMLRILKRLFIILLLAGVTGWLLRGWIYRSTVIYKPTGTRTEYTATDKALLALIDAHSDMDTTVQGIITHALKVTSHQLEFTAAKNETDPNQLIATKTAHCVGYAAFCASSCNYLFKKYGLGDTWEACPVAGKLYLLGMDIHQFFSGSFFKDHDFVLITNKVTGETIAVDPTVSDYLYINRVTCTE